ncbi:somatic embryogenesis receptor kinase 2-like [Camellia sinensis]|uniref:somatic embryogenesis receptor kinase 2-like n=1 Tax=Camellia sinensis TaxID=4442 RepID=UPI0010355DA6|nr:somatic embryogenesis receptor kinase 2-like [Camellia sinensis]
MIDVKCYANFLCTFCSFANNINLCGPVTGKSCPGSPPFAPSPFVPPSTISSPSLGKYYAVCANVESQVEIQCLTPRSKSSGSTEQDN